MPDHLHLVWMGLRLDSDQKNGMAFLRTHLKPVLRPAKFQPQAHDHVLRQEERIRNAFAKICFYILANPVRSDLTADAKEWPFHGAVIPGYPVLHPLQQDYWEKFWRLYAQAKQPNAGNLRHPLNRTVGDDVRSL